MNERLRTKVWAVRYSYGKSHKNTKFEDDGTGCLLETRTKGIIPRDMKECLMGMIESVLRIKDFDGKIRFHYKVSY